MIRHWLAGTGAIALIASMALLTACGGPDRVSRTTTTEQTTTAVPVQPPLGTTTTTTTEQTRQ